MLINLRKGWFDPSGNRRRPEDNPHDVPDDWKEVIPSTATVLNKVEAKAALAEEEPEVKPAVKK